MKFFERLFFRRPVNVTQRVLKTKEDYRIAYETQAGQLTKARSLLYEQAKLMPTSSRKQAFINKIETL